MESNSAAEVVLKDADGDTMLVAEVEGHYLLRGCTPEWRKKLREAPMRPDDVFVCGYPKTGHHWVWEIVKMLVSGETEYIKEQMEFYSFENMYLTPEALEKMKSPRVFTFHGFFRELPSEALAKGCKVICLQRGVKDVAVSMYNMVSDLLAFDYSGKWSGFFPAFLEGQVPFGSWFTHSLNWREDIANNPDHPVLSVSFEKTKADPAATIRQLANFLGVKVDDAKVEAIKKLTEFKSMKTFKDSVEKIYNRPDVSKSSIGIMFRKGKVGDWRHWLTVAQNDDIDRKLAETGLDKEPSCK